MIILWVPDTDLGPENIAFEYDMELNSDEIKRARNYQEISTVVKNQTG